MRLLFWRPRRHRESCLATWPPGQPQAQAKRLRTLRRVAVAVLALAAVQPAAAQQPSGTPPAGMATSGDHQKLQAELAAARADINAVQKKLDLP